MTTPDRLPRLLPLTPQYRERVWGGQRLKPSDSGTPIGEAWIAYGQSVVSAGAMQGQTLDQLLSVPGKRAELLGERGAAQAASGAGFPLLIKLLDCADWLSVQVHPNDEQARQMVGPGERGKTEAWHLLEAEPGAELIAGVKGGTTKEALASAIRGGQVLGVAQKIPVQAGDTVFIPAGTLHALGPGLLLYEVQQSSDTTYRVYDWDRPASAGRQLHIEQSVAVTDPQLHGDVRPVAQTHGQGVLLHTPYFVLDGLQLAAAESRQADTGGLSFHLVTVTEGQATLSCGEEQLHLGTFGTALVTAEAGAYSLEASGGEAHLLVSSLPG
jgi:mannose-6-phosphate isomerase